MDVSTKHNLLKERRVNVWGCYKIDGKEWTPNAKCYCTAETVDEAIEKSNKLEEKKAF